MGRQYAGILATIAFTVVIGQGLIRGTELVEGLKAALVSTMVFWAVGYAVGTVAGWIVRDSIHEEEIEALVGQLPPRRWNRATGD